MEFTYLGRTYRTNADATFVEAWEGRWTRTYSLGAISAARAAMARCGGAA